MTSLMGAAQVAFVTVLAMGVSAAPTQADYLLSPGDTVEIDIASIPEQTRAVIQVDGTISMPAAGRIPVAGLTLAELQTRMETVLPTKMFHFRSPDGREQVVVITPDDVTTAIIEYRPIYVTGDVLTPGQAAYRPLMTVRQAIAVAGGYSLLRSRMSPAGVDPADLQSEYESDWMEYLKAYFHAARTGAELRDQSTFDERAPQGSPLSPQLMSSIAQNEAKTLKTALEEDQQERTFMVKALNDAGEQIAVLLTQQQEEQQGVKADENEVALLTNLYTKGVLTNVRMSDSRRALLLSSDRELETTVELMQLRRQQADTSRQIERAANQRQIALQGDLKDTSVRLAELSVKLRADDEKLQPAGAGSRILPGAGEATHPFAVIARKVGAEWRRLAVGEDAEVLPGDVIEATLGVDSEPMTTQ